MAGLVPAILFTTPRKIAGTSPAMMNDGGMGAD
jgi:hypothetical protein